MTLFGTILVDAPRFAPCRCGIASRRMISPVTELMPDRCTPEYERVLAKMGALASLWPSDGADRRVSSGRERAGH